MRTIFFRTSVNSFERDILNPEGIVINQQYTPELA